MINKLLISEQYGEITYTISEPENLTFSLIVAHGAGAGMNHFFLNLLSEKLTKNGIRVIRFNFPYIEKGKKLPGKPQEAVICYEKITNHILFSYPDQPLFVSGKSYGGRMASLFMTESPWLPVKGLIYFGFPLHAPGKPSTYRANHLSQLALPQLFLQGTRDALAEISLIRQVASRLPQASLIEFEEADHSFKMPKSMGLTQPEMLETLAKESVSWMNSLT